VLVEALPYIRRFFGKVVVVKYGGNALHAAGDGAGGQNAERAAADARREAQEAKALLSRMQNGGDPARQPAPPPQPQPQDFETAVDQAAARKIFLADSQAVLTQGLTKFGAGFNESLNILTAIGATSDDMIADVLAVDKGNAHVLLDSLAKDPERTAALTAMNSRQRIAELTRMSMTPATPKADPPPPPAPTTKVSKAPPPPPPVEPSATKVVDGYSDEATDEQFTAQFNERMAARASRGRR